MKVRVDWDGDGLRVAEFDVARGEALASGNVPFRVTCPHGVTETIHYHPEFAAQPDAEQNAAIDGSCPECE